MLLRCAFSEIKSIQKQVKDQDPQPSFYAVARGVPVWWRGSSFQKLAPSWDLIKDGKAKKISWTEYEDRFLEEILCRKGIINLLKAIWKMSEQQDVYLVCWEKTEKEMMDTECHTVTLIALVQELSYDQKWSC